MDQEKIYARQDWTDEALLNDGFVAYRPVKRVVMMRMMLTEKAPLPDEENPEEIIPAPLRYWIAYRAGNDTTTTSAEYDPQPIESHIFAQSYRYWDEPDWQPTASEGHLQRLGCLPYFKTTPLWAKQLTTETWVQGKGKTKPVLAPVGAWLCVDVDGEPTTESEDWFNAHYYLPKQKRSAHA